MIRRILYVFIFLLLLTVPLAVRYLYFYDLNRPERAVAQAYDPANVPGLVPTPASTDFVDNPEVGQGLILLDQSHSNDFSLAEISYLDSRLAARGYELIPFSGGDLAGALRPVNALVVITPLETFSLEEVRIISDFVDSGGRLLMIGDPTRFFFGFEEDAIAFTVTVDNDEIPLNSLANEFDIVYQGDYLYNTTESEGNYRNIILKQEGLGESDLTGGIEKLAFYGSHSIQVGSEGESLLAADDNTWSSATDRPGQLALGVSNQDGRVIALGDIDFLSEPYYTVYDNSRFIAQLADFLAGDGREYVLADFPYFFQNDIQLVFAGGPDLGPDAFDEIIALQNAFRRTDKNLTLSSEPDDDQDILYLGLYNQAGDLAEMLEEADITLVIEPPIEEEEEDEENGNGEEQTRRLESSFGNVQMSGNILILLQEEGDSRQMIVLAASSAGLESAAARLIDLIPLNADYALSDCLLAEAVAVCPSAVANEPVEFELITSGVPDTTSGGGGGGTGGDTGGDSGPFNAVTQGPIALDETVSGTLGEGVSHAWVFSGGPALIDIVLDSGEELDGVLELYDPEGSLMANVDSAFAGEEERISSIEITDDGDYTIVVRDYFEDGGDYALTVTTAAPQDPVEDLDATPQGELPFGEAVTGVLVEEEFHAWTVTIDSPTTINLTLESGPEMDVVLAVLDPNNLPLALVDDGLAGEGERVEGLELAEAGQYTVVVGEFFGVGGEYTLLLEEADVAAGGLPAVRSSAFFIPVDNGQQNSTIVYFGSANKPFRKDLVR